ncbi:UvrD-helicase domain-containing protein [Rhizobium johnstonii]|uniref:UvrD-helicase domain-containing protein n=1 Tax=Rhizobium johnstonii TaxID=3019933 RepID=UPI003F9B23C7
MQDLDSDRSFDLRHPRGRIVVKTLGYKDAGIEAEALALLRHGKISQFGVAENLRRQVILRNGVTKAAALESVVELLELLGQPRALSRIVVQRVVDLLVDCGDIGQASAFGQLYLLPVQPRQVLLPTGKAISLGGSELSTGVPHDHLALFPEATDTESVTEIDARHEIGRPWKGQAGHDPDGSQTKSLSEIAEEDAWQSFCTSWPRFMAKGQGQIASLPVQIRKAIALCGTVDVEVQEWSFGEEALELLNLWRGAATFDEDSDGSLEFDPGQLAVVTAPANERLVVEAGPGSGKTHVAIGRITSLIEQGVPPSKIWLLSFTRVAVEEMRSRISERIESGAARSLNVATFDSLAWKLNRYFGGEPSPLGFEEAMKTSIRILASSDTALRDALEGMEHVIVDEAQDLVGLRRQMVAFFLESLSKRCGITILGDFAQAIYGWQAVRYGHPETGLQELSAHRQEQMFRQAILQRDHRTKSPKLAKMFRAAREALRNVDLTPHERYEAVRKLIEDAAENPRNTALEQIAAMNGKSLVLFRGRRAVISASHSLASRGMPLRIKLSNRSDIVAPWVGAVFAGVNPDSRINRAEFQTLWEDAGINPLEINSDTGWNEIRSLSGDVGDSISVQALCKRIDQDIPVRFLSDHIGTQGPTFSTIHGAKGKEADKVFLLLPPQPDIDDHRTDWDEEARILYVGATRARRQLFVGSRRAGYMYPTSSGRMWRGRQGDFSVEIGNPLDTTSDYQSDSVSTIRSANRRLLELVGVPLPCAAERSAHDAGYVIVGSDGAGNPMRLGRLTDRFIDDVCKIASCCRGELPDRLDGFFVVGASTIVDKDQINGARPLGLGLVPVLMGFTRIRIGER